MHNLRKVSCDEKLDKVWGSEKKIELTGWILPIASFCNKVNVTRDMDRL